MAMTTSQQVIAILAQQAVLDPSEVTPAMSMQDLGLDSLGLVEAMFAIEETFDVSVPFNANNQTDAAFDISTVATIIAAVEKLIAEPE